MAFKEKAAQDAVKMIEVKLSQGAKPGHGGILPAAKLTHEIAAIRGVPMGHDDPSEIGPRDVLRRIDATTIKRFGEIYEYLPEDLLLEKQGVPPSWAANWNRASADHF